MNNACPTEWAKEVIINAKVMKKHNISMADATTCLINPHCMLMQFSAMHSDSVIRAFANDLFHELGALDGSKQIDFGEGTDYCMLDIDDNPRRYYVMVNNRKVIDAKPGSEVCKYSVAMINTGAEDSANVSEGASESDIEEWEEGEIRIRQIDGSSRGKMQTKRLDCSREEAAIEEAKRRTGIANTGFNGINPYCYNVMLPLEVGDEKAAQFANIIFHAVGALDEGVDAKVDDGNWFFDFIRDEEEGCYCVIFNHHLVVEDDDLYEYSVEALRGDGEEDDEEEG